MVTPQPGAPMRWRCGAFAAILGTTALLLTGCVQPLRAPDTAPGERQWSGRLALTIQSEPVQSWASGFELRGGSSHGELQLLSPLGTTLAVLAWTPTAASLRQPTQQQSSGSLDELMLQVTGTVIPVRTLFDWLDGRPTELAGWQADLSQLAQGRLQLRRGEPAPAVELRLKLEREAPR